MDCFSCREIKKIVLQLMALEALKGKVFVAGGIVPYIFASAESNRNHADIDLVAEEGHMPIIRKYLKEQGFYKQEYDSAEFDYNAAHIDYGLEAFIDKVPVNFAPFSIRGNDIVQRNFMKKELSGLDALLTVTMKNIAKEDYITQYQLPDGSVIGTYTLEMVKCTKESTNRKKDRQDLKMIEKAGIDQPRYDRIKPVIKSMMISSITPED